MQAIFNELSSSGLESLHEEHAIKVFLELIDVCKHFQQLDSTFKLRISSSFWTIKIDSLDTIIEYLSNTQNDLFEELQFLQAITDSPYLPDEDLNINQEKFFDNGLLFQCKNVVADSGIRVAYSFEPKPAPIISFSTDDWKDLNYIKIRSSNKAIIELINVVTVNQFYELHFEKIVVEHINLSKTSFSSQLLNASTILPNKHISNSYLKHLTFYKQIEDRRVLNKEIGVTQIKVIGGKVANINGWQKDNNLSSINNREVFSHLIKDNIFLAIDTEKGDFEIHSSDRKNNHKGAISFDGAKMESPKSHKLKFEPTGHS